MEQKGYYSLVQFCPDLSRLESVNIGVILYSPSSHRLRVRLLPTNRRVKHFFGKQDWTFVERLKESLARRLENEQFSSKEQLESFISKRANAIQLTPLNAISIGELDQDIDKLFHELVSPADVSRKKRIDRYLGERLKEAGVSQMVRSSVCVHFPFFEEPIRAPYGYQNGRFNLIAPVQFGEELRDVLTKAGERALEGKLLYDNPDVALGQLRLNVVAQFSEELGKDARKMIERVLSENNVKFYTFEDLQPLLQDIRTSAAVHHS